MEFEIKLYKNLLKYLKINSIKLIYLTGVDVTSEDVITESCSLVSELLSLSSELGDLKAKLNNKS